MGLGLLVSREIGTELLAKKKNIGTEHTKEVDLNDDGEEV